MNRHKSLLTVVASLLALLIANPGFTQSASAVDREAIEQAAVANLSVHENNVYASAQPTPEQLQQLADAGVRHIINLRPESEQDWDEKSAAEAAGIASQALPVAGRAGLTLAHLDALDHLPARPPAPGALVHC